MRILLTTLALTFTLTVSANACDSACKQIPPQKLEKIKVELTKQKADKWSHFSKCKRLGGSEKSCAAEVIFYMGH